MALTRRRLAAAAALLPLTVLAVQGWSLRWVADDAFINFRVVDQIAHGNGPVFNAGERVEAFTSPLWLGSLWLGSAGLGIQVEWLAVVLGLALSVAGLGAACAAAALLARGRESDGVLVPLGALVFAALPAAWEFATSGLETGLSFAWLGGSFLYLVRTCLAEPPRRAWPGAVLLCLGPLVRPDFAIFSIGFVAVLLVAAGRPWRWRGAGIAAAALALPLLAELLRMAYYAALVPNTAVAKEASGIYWSQGLGYLWDLLGTYWLWLPLAALGAWTAARWRAARRGGDRTRALLLAVPVVTGLVHVLFVVKVGGDFMHARMLLPGVFAILMPAAVVPVPARRAGVALAVGVAAWALVCGLALRVPFSPGDVAAGEKVVDERSYYVAQPGVPDNPVTLGDYRRDVWVRAGAEMRRRAAAGERVVTFAGPNFNDEDESLPDSAARPGLPAHVVAPSSNVGLFGYAAGTDVWVVDRLGIADPLAARERLVARGRVGHEKVLPAAWVVARFSDPSRLPPALAQDPGVRAAQFTLQCSAWRWDGSGVHFDEQLPRTLTTITRPLTLGRLASNVGYAATTDKWRFPADPQAAQAELCGPPTA